MTHKKYLTTALLEDNDHISAEFTAKILSLNLADSSFIELLNYWFL